MIRNKFTNGAELEEQIVTALSLPPDILAEATKEYRIANEQFFDRGGIEDTKREMLLIGHTYDDLDKEIKNLEDAIEEIDMRKEFDYPEQKEFLTVMLDHMKRVTATIKAEGLFIPVKVYVERATINGKKINLPFYANIGDAGCDVEVLEDITIAPNSTIIIPTGFKFAIPIGYEIQVRLRSSIGLRTPLRIPNAPGTIDSGYRGEVGIIVWNSSNEPYTILATTRIAQLILAKVERIEWEEVEKVESIGTSRENAEGQHGFGSTGE